jgi:hypothetical protein
VDEAGNKLTYELIFKIPHLGIEVPFRLDPETLKPILP